MSIYKMQAYHTADQSKLLGELFDYLCDEVESSPKRNQMIHRISELEDFDPNYTIHRISGHPPEVSLRCAERMKPDAEN